MMFLTRLVAVACAILGFAVATGWGSPGQAVPINEVERCMGSCATVDVYHTMNICYYDAGTNTWCGGCGCSVINRMIPGFYKITDATPCDASWSCTAPQSVTCATCAVPQ